MAKPQIFYSLFKESKKWEVPNADGTMGHSRIFLSRRPYVLKTSDKNVKVRLYYRENLTDKRISFGIVPTCLSLNEVYLKWHKDNSPIETEYPFIQEDDLLVEGEVSVELHSCPIREKNICDLSRCHWLAEGWARDVLSYRRHTFYTDKVLGGITQYLRGTYK